jgi:hypothetical protein
MLTRAKKISLADRLIRRGVVQDRRALRVTELLGKTLGIVGVGQIGGRLIELCAPFTMTVLAYDPYLDEDELDARGATKVELDELLARSDFVHLNCPLTPETEGLMGREQFARMKPSAFFVTTARGPVHDEDALHDALVGGTIAGAGIDVFHREPPDPQHPLLALDNVVASPHTAGITVEATRDIALATADQWITIFAGKRPPRLINPEAWPTYSDRFPFLRRAARASAVTTKSAKVRAARSSGDRRRRPLGRLFPVYFDHIAEGPSPHASTGSLPVRAPSWLVRLTVGERRRPRLCAVAPGVCPSTSGTTPPPLPRPSHDRLTIGASTGDRVPEHRADLSGHRVELATAPPGLQHDGRGPVLAVPTGWCRGGQSWPN